MEKLDLKNVNEGFVLKNEVELIFKEHPKLHLIGTPEQYSLYLTKIFPETSAKKVLYHGSRSKFNDFQKEFLGKATKAESAKNGFFFTDNLENAHEYIKTEYRSDDERERFNEYSEIKTEELHTLWEKSDEIKSKIRELESELNREEKVKEKRRNEVAKELVVLHSMLTPIESEISATHTSKNDFNAVAEISIYPVVINIKNPLVASDKKSGFREESYYERIQKAKREGRDGVIIHETADPLPGDIYITFEPEQIHILGAQSDMDEFTQFVKESEEYYLR